MTVSHRQSYLDAHIWHDGKTWRANVPLAYGAGRKRISSVSLDLLKKSIEDVRLGQPSKTPFDPQDLAALRAALDMLPDGLTLTEAVRLGVDAWTADRRRASKPLEEVAREWLDLVRQSGRRHRTLLGYESNLHKFAPLRKKSIASIGLGDLRPVMAAQTPSAADGLRRVGHALWAYALRAGYLSRNVWEAVPRPRRDAKLPQIYTPAQVRAVMDAAVATDPRLVPYLAICFFTGTRPGAVALLRPCDIDRTRSQILIRPSLDKLRRSYYAPIRPTLAAWLDAYPPADPMLPCAAKSAFKRLRAIFAAAGVPRIRYATRHTFASYALAINDPPHAVALALGHFHDVTTLFEHYRALADQLTAQLFWNILPCPHPPKTDSQ